MRIEPADSGGRPRPAELQVEFPHRVEPSETFFALATHKRMLEQSQERDRCKLFGRGARNAKQQGAGGRSRQWLASTVVSLNAPARQERGHSSRELAVGRDQPGGLSRSLDGLPQGQRDRLSFRSWIGQLSKPDAAQAPLGGRKGLPLVREFGRGHRVGDSTCSRWGGRQSPRPPPCLNLSVRNPEAVEQQL